MRIDSLFDIHIGRSHAFKSYSLGDAAFVTNGLTNNGVQGFVRSQRGDRVFEFDGICVSAFCEATVHRPPFIARGNGGSGLNVLEPVEELSRDQMLFYAAYINSSLRWRFSFGRMVTRDRIKGVEVPNSPESVPSVALESVLPPRKQFQVQAASLENLKKVRLSDLFEIESGDYHVAGDLDLGGIPLVSCGEKDHGIVGYYDIPEDRQYVNALTVAYNGRPLTAHYHSYVFGAKDDVAVCIPREPFSLSTMTYLQYAVDREAWRFSYGRKCFKEKLCRQRIVVPTRADRELDQDKMREMVSQTTYWDFLLEHLESGIKLTP